MTKLSDLGEMIFGKPVNSPEEEREHFYKCRHCGQIVDRRDLRQVLWHEQQRHKPLEMDA